MALSRQQAAGCKKPIANRGMKVAGSSPQTVEKTRQMAKRRYQAAVSNQQKADSWKLLQAPGIRYQVAGRRGSDSSQQTAGTRQEIPGSTAADRMYHARDSRLQTACSRQQVSNSRQQATVSRKETPSIW